MAKAFPKFGNLGPAFELAPKLFAFFLTAAKVIIHGGLMFQLERDCAVDTSQRERRKAILNLFSGSSLVELIHHRVERDAGAN